MVSTIVPICTFSVSFLFFTILVSDARGPEFNSENSPVGVHGGWHTDANIRANVGLGNSIIAKPLSRLHGLWRKLSIQTCGGAPGREASGLDAG